MTTKSDIEYLEVVVEALHEELKMLREQKDRESYPDRWSSFGHIYYDAGSHQRLVQSARVGLPEEVDQQPTGVGVSGEGEVGDDVSDGRSSSGNDGSLLRQPLQDARGISGVRL